MAGNPEDHVLDEIDALVNETMAAGVDRYGRPLDDYSRDRYPDCDLCHHSWHGLGCEECGCQGSTGEVLKAPYVDQVTGVRYGGLTREQRESVFDEGAPWESERGLEIIPDAPWVTHSDEPSPVEVQRGYTRAQLEELRSRSWVHHNYPQRFVLGEQARQPRIRFWARDDEGVLRMIEGVAQVLRIDWNRGGASVQMRLDIERDITRTADHTLSVLDPVPVAEFPDGMVAMEGARDDGDFEAVGHLHPEDLDIEYNQEFNQRGGRVFVTAEHWGVTMRINAAAASPVLRRLEGGAPWR